MHEKRLSISFGEIASLITIVIGAHYLLSYKWLYGLMKMWGIESLSILTIDDLTFPLADMNLKIFLFIALGFLLLYLIFLVPHRIILSEKKDIIEKFKKVSNRTKYIAILIIFVISIVFYFIFLKSYLESPTNKLTTSYLFLAFVFPFIYLFVRRHRKWLLVIYSILMLAWGNYFIEIVLLKTQNSTSKNENNISFSYDGKTINTSDHLKFLYHGYKYIVLSDSKGKVYLYETDRVSNITYKK